jgi:hypothetical protein
VKSLNFRYIFRFPDDRQKVIDLHLDAQTLELISDTSKEFPPWTDLDFHQCPNCQLTIQTNPNCPVAVHLVNPVLVFKNVVSYDEIHVDIITPERIVVKDTTAQKGISSLMGLIMATSGCTHLSYLKPMARFHLPLATAEETVYRATSMYLLAQYFLQQKGYKSDADLNLEGLLEIYRNIELINKAIADRLRAIAEKDSAINALVLLDIYAKTLPHAIEDSLKDMQYLFAPYFRK